MQEGEGGGEVLSDNICQLWPSFTTRIKLTIKSLEGPPPPEQDIILLSIVAIVYICNIYSYSVLDEQYTPWVLLAVRSNAKCLDHVDTNKTGQKFTVTRGCVTACHSFGRRPLIFLWYVTIDWLQPHQRQWQWVYTASFTRKKKNGINTRAGPEFL